MSFKRFVLTGPAGGNLHGVTHTIVPGIAQQPGVPPGLELLGCQHVQRNVTAGGATNAVGVKQVRTSLFLQRVPEEEKRLGRTRCTVLDEVHDDTLTLDRGKVQTLTMYRIRQVRGGHSQNLPPAKRWCNRLLRM